MLYKIFNPTNMVKTRFLLEKAQGILLEFADKCLNDERLYGDFALYFAKCAINFIMLRIH